MLIIIFICQKTGQQRTKCTQSCPTNKQNILDLQKQIANASFHCFISVLFFTCWCETVKQDFYFSFIYVIIAALSRGVTIQRSVLRFIKIIAQKYALFKTHHALRKVYRPSIPPNNIPRYFSDTAVYRASLSLTSHDV